MVESAIEKVEMRLGRPVRLPMLGQVTLPPPERLVYYAGLGLLAVFEVVEWPVALVVGTGHLLADQQHRKLVRGLGEALEEA
ncbi:hypothetical protein NE236_02600 [Actinoallomurus purpureus]|uniref:hypothetical protein n=1 Tax=Actinoallomurus purpureus TaxID=478114 RepID=UPI00209228B1|nr:hypothetical protein [Actinoallomurus purpureus]MCO6003859.1 hypothetical protein [Actinoallomurus purpureus]